MKIETAELTGAALWRLQRGWTPEQVAATSLERDLADAKEQAQQSSAEAQRAWAVVAHILNGRPVKVDERTALFVEVHEERDLCSAC